MIAFIAQHMVDVDQKTNKQKIYISVKCQEIWLRDELRASEVISEIVTSRMSL